MFAEHLICGLKRNLLTWTFLKSELAELAELIKVALAETQLCSSKRSVDKDGQHLEKTLKIMF